MSKKDNAVKDYTGQEFVIVREFAAPRALVFKAWTDPNHLAQWWGPKGFTNPVCEWDPRPGNAIYVVMRAPNGTDYPMGGEFREILPPERLVFTSGALDTTGKMLFEFLHTVTFVEHSGKTTLTIRARVTKTTADANKYIGGFEAGMTQSLERLDEHLSPKSGPLINFVENDFAGREIVISRILNAPRELVWQAMTDPQHVVHWWGPRGFSTTIEEMDFRVGGVWKHVMHGPDGADYPNKSVFTKIVKPECIAYSHGGHKEGGPGAQFESTWTFDALDDSKTKVTIRMLFPSAEERERVVKEFGAVEGGEQTLERLSEHLPRMAEASPPAADAMTLVVTRMFSAPAERVFDAWLDPASVCHWLFATPDGEMRRVEIEPRVGGKLVIVEKRGETLADHVGTYEVIDRPRRLVFSYAYQGGKSSCVTIEIEPLAGGCKLTLTHKLDPEWAAYVDKAREGWTMVLEGLAAALPEGRDFIITRVFNAPIEQVWKAWTEPERMAQWWGPQTITIPVCEMDVRPGGLFRIVMRGPDGTDFLLKGVYREVTPPKRLVMIMDCSEYPAAWHDLVNPNRDKSKKPTLECVQTVAMEELDGKTTLTIRTRFESVATRDAVVKTGMNEGWSQSLDRLAERLSPIPAR
jgi:uncharacterized protein YndB with AHSA1/START domain